MTYSRCKVSSRDLFFLIVFIATLSLLFNYQISYYGNVIEDQRVVKSEIYGVPVVTSLEDDDGAKRVLGRSLSQHALDVSKNWQQDSEDRVHNKLLKKLQEIESLAGSDSAHFGIVFHGFSDDVRSDVINKVHGLRNNVKQQAGGLSWVAEDTIVQGNWSVMICKDRCPNIHVDLTQKVNRIPSIERITNRPDITCTIAQRTVQTNHKLKNICQPFTCNKTTFNQTVLLSLSNKNYVKSSFEELCNRGDNFVHSVVWRLPEERMIFHAGPVLRIHCLVTSFTFLRFYAHPVIYTGPYTALQTIQLFKKISLEDLLQVISDTYGLGTSSKWWRAVQSTLLFYFLHAEMLAQSETPQQRNTSTNFFQSLQVDLVCPSVQHCQIIQVSSNSTYELDVIDSILSLVNSRRSVATDVLQALENLNYRKGIGICEENNIVVSGQCLTMDYLQYLMKWRAEIMQRTEWIPMYPSMFGCRELKNGKSGYYVESNTIKMNEITFKFGDYVHWTEDTNSELQYSSDGNIDYAEIDGIKVERTTDGATRLCSNESEDFGKIREIITYPEVNLTKTSSSSYLASVNYDVILIRLWVTSASCKCQIKLENKYNDPGPRNITLGLGENRVMVYVVEENNSAYNIINSFTLNIIRNNRGMVDQHLDDTRLATCGLKQECSSKYDHSAPCGLIELTSPWHVLPSNARCSSGDHEGQWTVPCQSCSNESSCYWTKAKWRPYECQYRQLSPSSLKSCLRGKKILFIGDSTNRGVSNYITEQINGSLYDWDKTHSTKIYTNVNGNQTQISFAYYPHFWLPSNHRPKFSKVIYQLIKSSLPLQNNSNTILVVGGVHWLARQHIDLIDEALQSKGLSGITKAVKGLGAGFHQKVEDVRFIPESEQPILQQRETEILNYAKSKDFRTIATFNMTISRYKDFQEGKCACHFHKLTKQVSQNGQTYYSVEGKINEAYSQILLNQICLQSV